MATIIKIENVPKEKLQIVVKRQRGRYGGIEFAAYGRRKKGKYYYENEARFFQSEKEARDWQKDAKQQAKEGAGWIHFPSLFRWGKK